MQSRFLWPVVVCAPALCCWRWSGRLVTARDWTETAGWAVALGVVATLAVGIGLMAIIFQGRRSRRDRLVDRNQHHGQRIVGIGPGGSLRDTPEDGRSAG